MDLSEIREKFRDLTGRYDLVTANNTDLGADFFINAGQRWLDRQLDFQGASAETTLSLSAGAYSTEVSGLRAVKNVFVDDPSDGFRELERDSYEDIKAYGIRTSSPSTGLPRWYATGRRAPDSRNSLSQEIMFWPPADTGHVMIVEGLFASSALSNDSDESLWSVAFPDVLVKAAAFRAEAFQRNTSGESDYRQSLMNDLRGIDHDEVEEAIADMDERKNGWRNIDL